MNGRKSLITEATMLREDSEISLPPLAENDNMALEFEIPHSVTFSRQNTFLPNGLPKDIENSESEKENRTDALSRAASRNLSRASFIHSANRKRGRDKTRRLSSVDIDFDADFEWDSEDEDQTARYSSAAEQHQQMYRMKCQKLGIIPCRKAMNQFSHSIFNLNGLNLTAKELSAIYVVMINDVDIAEIDLSGNSLGVKDINYISEILQTNKSISALSLKRCGLSGQPIRVLADFLSKSNTLQKLDISDNCFDDKDAPFVAQIIEKNESLCSLNLSQNRLGDSGVLIGNALMENEMLTTLDLSWNHLRGIGAIGVARGVEKNSRLLNLMLSWNGFAFEGSAALGHALLHNSTLSSLDLANNRIHNPAMFELLKGVCSNKSLSTIRLAMNPITAPMTSIVIQRIYDSKECGIKELDLEGVVVDKEFDAILTLLQEHRLFMARYDISLPVRKGFVTKIDRQNIFNIDPIRILYFMKDHMRTIDMLLRFDKDNSNTLSRDELRDAFAREGYPISSSALDSVMNYLDTNKDGTIDLLELIDGERRLKRQLIAEREEIKKNPTTGPSVQEKKEYSKAFLKPSESNSPRNTTSPRNPSSPRNKLPQIKS